MANVVHTAGPPGLAPVSPGLLAALRGAMRAPDGLRHRASDRLALANDASHYLLTPQAVAVPSGAAEVAALLRASAEQGVPLTFRAGGTSLSGQSVTDGVLVDVRRHFRDIEVLDDGLRVRVQPGATVRQVNTRLAPYHRKLGPDPASESACTVGGVVANNSSGMACGTADNTYRTLESVVLVLPSGTVVDSAAPDADERLRALEPALHEGIARLRDRVRADPASVATIEQQFSMKNTMGYGLNSFLDHTRPVDVLAHLVVGSEGTLAFIAEATFRTVPVHAHAATGLLVFDDLAAATGSLPALVGTGPATIELLDAVSLRVAQRDRQADALLRSIDVDRHAALLVEYSEPTADGLAATRAAGAGLLASLPLTSPAELTGDAAARARLWHIRKGLYAAVAGARPSGTTALLEDVVVPVAALLRTCEQLTGLFARHGYEGSVIFGHAKDGNVHFLLNERFDDPLSLERYHRFTEDMVDLVLGEHGSLKAEHGTGRIMTPYVRRQYGDELYEVMREIKRLCDPVGLLNPGVVLDDDPQAHVRDLKTTPTVEAEVDRCVECGFCEPVCPSRDLTTTPRQRIVLRRAMATAEARGDHALLAELRADYRYDAVDTCAVDGMCQTACPVTINTGDLVRRLRAEDAGTVSQGAWRAAAGRWGATTRLAAVGLHVAAALPTPVVTAANLAARRVAGDRNVPLWSDDLPRGGHARPAGGRPVGEPLTGEALAGEALAGESTDGAGPGDRRPAEAVFFAACIGSMFGPAADGGGSPGRGAGPAFLTLCRRAGVEVALPAGLPGLCCGTPWKSKGLTDGHDVMRDKVLPALLEATAGGTLPVVVDASSCTEGLRELLEGAESPSGLTVVDAVDFVLTRVLPRLTVADPLGSVTVHPTCSSTRIATTEAMVAVARAVAHEVVVPADWGCCGFAGDRGLLHPELTASATRPETATVHEAPTQAYASCNRTCELGMSRATGHQYRHVLELLEEVTR